jgi:hypothetical protein
MHREAGEGSTMTGKDVNSIGLVGARGYELQSWQSPSANALEDAYWATQAPEKLAPEKHPRLKSRLMQFIDGISAAVVIVATPK